jgi:hypothetical protein
VLSAYVINREVGSEEGFEITGAVETAVHTFESAPLIDRLVRVLLFRHAYVHLNYSTLPSGETRMNTLAVRGVSS